MKHTWKKAAAGLLALMLAAGALPAAVDGGGLALGTGITANAADAVTYLDASGTEQSITSYTVVSSNDDSWDGGWYVVNSDVEIRAEESVEINGNVNLVLCDGAKLTINASERSGLYINSNRSLAVYAQSTGETMGVLDVTGGDYEYGISGFQGNLTVNGGNVTVNNGVKPFRGNVTINGGTFTSNGNGNCGIIGGSVNISGGDVTLTTVEGSSGIDASGDVTISGGTVDVGCGYNSGISVSDGGNVIISGGKVTARGTGTRNPGINGNGQGNVIITGGKLTAFGINWATVKNSIAGTGWTDTEGTQGMADIAVNENGQDLSSFNKVQFPPVSAAVEDKTDITDATVDLNADNTVASVTVGDETITDLSDFEITYGTTAENASSAFPTAPGKYYAFVTAKPDSESYTGMAASEQFVVDGKLTDGEYKQTAVRTEGDQTTYYTRFIFVRPMSEIEGKGKAVFTAHYAGKDYTFKTNTCYTGVITNGVTYVPESKDSVLFIVTVSSNADISADLTCDLKFLELK